MNAINREQLLAQLNWRYATKQFDPERKISPEDWGALEEALVLSPSSYGLQPWKFIVVTEQTVKEKLAEASYGQRQPADASHHVVFAIKKIVGVSEVENYLDRIAQVRQTPRASLAGFRDAMLSSLASKNGDTRHWATRQVYIALGNFLTSAALLGIDVCPMEGIDPEQYDKILGLDRQGLTAVVAAAAGYRAATDHHAALKKVRFPREEVLVIV